jgi:hypothetical protein
MPALASWWIVANTKRAITIATREKLKGLANADPFLVEMALALARLMDDEPTSAVAKELRTVVDLLTTQTDTGAARLDALFSGPTVGDPENPDA